MEWPGVSQVAIVLGVSCSLARIDPDSPAEIARHCNRVRFPNVDAKTVAEIATVIRARNAHIAAILAARRPQGSLFPEPAPEPRQRAYRRK